MKFEEVVKQQAKEDLLKAKGWLAEAHDRLRNHQVHDLADQVLDLIERVSQFLRHLNKA